ncbi:MAG: sulfatase [Dysgonamonadaceae bacterium]|jgi:arylsulfatase A-like enzyme|nr:sulfatase [Dysgonamonadaceae bacterium]
MNPKLFVSTAAVALIGTGTGQAQSKPKEEKPMNVVFFLVDDLGWSDTGCYGSRFYETPNIDRFAKEGVRFTNAYAACHVSSPSRASILTGKYPASINLTDWLPGRLDFPFQKLKNVQINQHLPYNKPTIPTTLQENGYHTAIFGKWHLGEDSASTARQGFDLHVPSGWNKGWPNKGYFSPYGLKGLKDGQESEYLTDRLTTEALKYIEENKDKPFFLYLSHFAVHDPIEGRPDLVEKYKKKSDQMIVYQNYAYVLEGDPDTPFDEKSYRDHEGYRIFSDRTVKIKQHQDNVEFASMVESMDESFGRVLNELKKWGIDDHTIVIFYSDNGGMSAANFYSPDRVIQDNKLDKAFSTSNLPLRGGKGWLYEGGIRVPLIVKWPGKGLQGVVCDVPVTGPDFFPTILDMLKIKTKPELQSDGISFTPLLKGETKIDRDAIFWHFPHYSNHGMQSPGGAVRCGDYKLLEYYENNTVQLFNLKNDREEQHDLVSSEPEIVNKLREMLHNWRKQINAKMMEPNSEYKVIP